MIAANDRAAADDDETNIHVILTAIFQVNQVSLFNC